MYINKYTHEVVKDCDLTLEHGYDEKYIFVPKGATFAIGTSFDGDFCWRKDRYYLNTNHIMSGCLKSTNVDVKTHKDTYELNTLWIHPDVKQKMLQGEIPNQITEKEWMRFDHSKLIGCVVNYCGEDVVINSFGKILPDIGFDVVYIEDETIGTVGEKRDKVLNNCYFYLEDGTMVSFDEYKGVYYND